MVPAEPEKEIKIGRQTRPPDKQQEPVEMVQKQEESIKIFDYSNPQRAASEMAAAETMEEVGFHKTNIVNEYPGYRLPPTGLLKEYESKKTGNRKELLLSARKLEDTLNTFGVVAKVIQVSVGPTITRYELQPSPGVKVSRILNLSDDIALSMAATSVRIEAPYQVNPLWAEISTKKRYQYFKGDNRRRI